MLRDFTSADCRVIAMDLPGMGRSDKLVMIEDYSYIGQTSYLVDFIDVVGLADAILVVQDWGANIGLKLVGDQQWRFAAVVAANGAMPLFPAGVIP
jgi:haloalkane dehalogenase